MGKLPLAGIKLVTLALNVPGPVAAARLVQLGAKVVKVEPPAGDPLRQSAHPWYDSMVQGQSVLTLDLKTPEGQREVNALLADSDVLLTSFRPSALRRLDLDWETLHRRYPKLCVVNIVGFPPPDEDLPGHDLTYQASLGLLSPPRLPATLHADLAGSERAVTATFMLLFERLRTGESGCACVSLFECIRDFTGPLTSGLTVKDGVLGGGFPFYSLYRTNDGWIALGALEPAFIKRLTAELSLTDNARAEMEAIFLTRSAAEWEQWAKEHDLPLAAVSGSRSG